MANNAVLDLPLSAVMRWEIALPLQQILHLHTVGSLLRAWRNPSNHDKIEKLFDTPAQAHHAIAVCATWLGVSGLVSNDPARGNWWPSETSGVISA